MRSNSIQEIRTIFLNNKNEIAFLIGNGINRYKDDNKERSWDNLIKNLVEEYTDLGFDITPSGISLTELYDLIEIKSKFDTRKKNIQEKVIKTLENWVSSDTHTKIAEQILSLNASILTTNFDYLLAKSLGVDKYSNIQGKFNHFFPWNYYFSTTKVDDPKDGFAIWHINGMQDYPESIRLGLTHYMGMIRKAHSLIHKNENNPFSGKNIDRWEGYQTWLHIIFNKSLFIFGLGLDEQEVFLRWLLIERAKYFKKFPDRKKKGWYVQIKETDNKGNEGKKLFLNALGIDVLYVETLKEFYEDLWKLDFQVNLEKK